MTKSAVRVVICPECKAEFPVPKGFAHTVLMKHMKEHMKQHKDVRQMTPMEDYEFRDKIIQDIKLFVEKTKTEGNRSQDYLDGLRSSISIIRGNF